MSLALQLARKGVYTARPNPCVGCVIVNDGVIVGEGWHQQFGQAHAEINALKQAGDKARGATCYVTLEPCAHMGKTGPCANALVDAGIKQVIAAMGDPNPRVSGKGFDILRDAGIEVKVGLLEASAKLINKGFISRMQRNRPWVICKLAMSLDGRTALANGKSKWITGPAARADVQKLRARQDAIITGIGTVIADNPSLTVRAADTMEDDDPWFTEANKNGFQQPKRVLLDPNQKASGQEKVFNADTQVFWVTRRPIDSALDDHIVNWSATDALPALLEEMVKVGCNSVLLEAGHTLAGSFLKAGLIDELVVYMAPKLMGSTAMGLVSLDLDCMQDIVDLELTDLRKVGNDIRMTYQVKGD
ncbi:bifunctional diaminohydroxyphosphoribosylaminopyrimidine deaminase/5-amino-6-(5-phosphoribosylamino)uracil reductase RibD [Aliikangiella marina]|uniref:Riboflavin biosynthesis protein RibD n=2 Tax=Aliikangiella marina TaxID=1712262 RepID=A0A545TAB0_9GAMM|nr:bifunctional diaminohydroxyphosphoribosylaminopyrimidine deaminase/5-amino-6-(5-phosphoribosylamino)uracil reductase RibD [Aliikangiella marina]